jgi:hypothetical protein
VHAVYSLARWPLVFALIGLHPLLLEIIGGSTLAEVTGQRIELAGRAGAVVGGRGRGYRDR